MAIDYHAVLGTNLFTFLLGPEEVPIHIHEGVVKNLSQPLHAMMTNGMKESAERKAKLDDIDSRTFALFAEYAYTGAYRLPPNGEVSENLIGRSEVPRSEKVAKYCRGCGTLHNDRCTSAVCRRYNFTFSAHLAYHCTYCAQRLGSGKESRCTNCTKPPQTCSLSKPQKDARSFAERKYNSRDMQHEELRNFLQGLKPADEPSDELTMHARLYMFADRYLVEALKDLCLHKLHRDLTCFKLTATTASELFEVLEFTNMSTETNIGTNGKSTEPSMGKELRDLVGAYAALQAEKLVEYDAFKEMLTEGGHLFTEFTCLIAKRIKD